MSNLFEKVKQEVSIIQVLSDHGLQPNHENKIHCLWHSEKTPSCLINSNNTFKCFGCDKSGSVIDVFMELNKLSDVREAALQMAEKYGVKVDSKESNEPYPPARLANDKGLTFEELKAVGICEASDFVTEYEFKMNGSLIPYYQMDGSPARPRFRYGPKASHGIQWKTKTRNMPMVPYGIWLIKKMVEINRSYMVIEEGETDWLTFKHYHIPAIGIPGSTMIKLLKLEYVSPFESIYIWREPDNAGKKFASISVPNQLKKIGYTGKVFIIHGSGIKDPNDLHRACLKDGTDFMERWQAIIAQAEPIDLAMITDKKSASIFAYPLTDLGNAERFAAQHKDNVKYCLQTKQWFIYDGKRWSVDLSGQVRRFAKLTVRSIPLEAAAFKDKDEEYHEIMNHALKSEKETAIRAMLNLAQTEEGIAVTMDVFDRDPFLLNCPNGTIDLRTGSIREHRRSDFITKMTQAPFNATAMDESWIKFLETVIPDFETRVFLQVAAGYSMTGDTGEEKLFFLYGPAGTGKSTFLSAIQSALGDYAATADFETFLVKDKSSGPRNDIARLHNKRLVISLEVDDGRKLAEALVNSITGGDTITARFLYSESFEFLPTFKLWLAANARPKITSDKKSGIWRRILQVPFYQQIPPEKRNPELKKYLKDPGKAGPAILTWLIEGCLLWQKEGLGVPPEVEEATKDYQDSMDPLKEFLSDCCVIAPNAKVHNTNLYHEYEDWCRENGNRYWLSHKNFTQRLSNEGFVQKRSGRSRYWIGIGIVASNQVTEVTQSDADSRNFTLISSYKETLGKECHQPSQASQANNGVDLRNVSGDDYEPY